MAQASLSEALPTVECRCIALPPCPCFAFASALILPDGRLVAACCSLIGCLPLTEAGELPLSPFLGARSEDEAVAPQAAAELMAASQIGQVGLDHLSDLLTRLEQELVDEVLMSC